MVHFLAGGCIVIDAGIFLYLLEEMHFSLLYKKPRGFVDHFISGIGLALSSFSILAGCFY